MAQFARFIHVHFPLEENWIHNGSIKEIEQSLNLNASEYWDTHYLFGKPSPYSIKKMGQQAIQHLIINVLTPYFLALDGTSQKENGLSPKKKILHYMKAESNQIIKKWCKFGIQPGNAYESQALLQLYKEYCIPKRCKHCYFGKDNQRLLL